MEKRARFRTEKVAPFPLSSVFSEAHIPGKHIIGSYFTACRRRNSVRPKRSAAAHTPAPLHGDYLNAQRGLHHPGGGPFSRFFPLIFIHLYSNLYHY